MPIALQPQSINANKRHNINQTNRTLSEDSRVNAQSWPQHDSRYPTLTAAPLAKVKTDALTNELNALYRSVMNSLGSEEARYIKRVYASVVYSKILNNMELGHNIMHGQYDWMQHPYLNSQKFDCDIVCPAPARIRHFSKPSAAEWQAYLQTQSKVTSLSTHEKEKFTIRGLGKYLPPVARHALFYV